MRGRVAWHDASVQEEKRRLLELLELLAAERTGPLEPLLQPGPQLTQLTEEIDTLSGDLFDRNYIDGALYSRLYDLLGTLRAGGPWETIQEQATTAATHLGAWMDLFGVRR